MKLLLTTEMLIDLRSNASAWNATIAFIEATLPDFGSVEIDGTKYSGEEGLVELKERLRL